MKHFIIAIAALTCVTTTLDAESPRESFVKSWKGQPVVVKAPLYSLVFNERGVLGNTRAGRREGVLVVTSPTRYFFQFDGRQGRETVVAGDPAVLVRAVSTTYQGDALDIRSYRKIEPLAVEQFVPGAELVVSAVRIERDLVKFEFMLPDGTEEETTSLRIKWPLPFSSSFTERPNVEELLRNYLQVRQP